MKKTVTRILALVMAMTCILMFVACGGQAASKDVDKAYVARIGEYEMEYEGQTIHYIYEKTLTTFTDGTYELAAVTEMILNGSSAGTFSNISFGKFTSVADDPSDPDCVDFILTLATPDRIIHQESYNWGEPTYIDTADSKTFGENEAGNTNSLEEQIEVIRQSWGGTDGTYSATVNVNVSNGSITDFVSDAPAVEW